MLEVNVQEVHLTVKDIASWSYRLVGLVVKASAPKRKVRSSSSSAIDSRAGQICSPVDATKPAVR